MMMMSSSRFCLTLALLFVLLAEIVVSEKEGDNNYKDEKRKHRRHHRHHYRRRRPELATSIEDEFTGNEIYEEVPFETEGILVVVKGATANQAIATEYDSSYLAPKSYRNQPNLANAAAAAPQLTNANLVTVIGGDILGLLDDEVEHRKVVADEFEGDEIYRNTEHYGGVVYHYPKEGSHELLYERRHHRQHPHRRAHKKFDRYERQGGGRRENDDSLASHAKENGKAWN